MNHSFVRRKYLAYFESEVRDALGLRSAASIGLAHAMRKARLPMLHPRLVIIILIVLVVAGCHERLAYQDEYFAPFGGAISAVKAETQRLVTYHEALQALQRLCTREASPPVSPDAVSFNGPVPEVASDGKARMPSCIPSSGTRAAYGSATNAYTRWVEDRVRPLPDPSETASSITGGS